MVQIGTPMSTTSTRAMVLGSGELGKEVVIELQRLGVETIAVDRYDNAPAMQVAHSKHVIDMQDSRSLRLLVQEVQPHYIIPEIEAIATKTLVSLESKGYNVIPTAAAAHLTMNRGGIRKLAAIDLGLPTSKYQFASTHAEYLTAIEKIGYPSVVKPIMSSSGRGQSTVSNQSEALNAWEYALEDARGSSDEVMVEELINFDYEITLLTVRHVGGLTFCEPVGHRQVGGDYQESWQPHPMEPEVLDMCKDMAAQITERLGGYGLFGVEFFIKENNVYFSELSPRPHDTGMVTMISQDLSEFGLHARALLGLPIPEITFYGPSASAVILVHGNSDKVCFGKLDDALNIPQTQVRLFGKPTLKIERRMGVALARGESVEAARNKAMSVVQNISVTV